MTIVSPSAILDARLYYTGDQARELLGGFNASERLAYFHNELLDFLFMATYSALLFLWARRVLPARFRWIAFVPGVLDLIETSFILYAASSAGPWAFFDWLGCITLLKWVTGGVVIVVLVVRGVLRTRARK